MVVMPSIKAPSGEGWVMGDGRWENRAGPREKAPGLCVSGISCSHVNDLAAAPGGREMTIISFNTPRGMIWKQEA